MDTPKTLVKILRWEICCRWEDGGRRAFEWPASTVRQLWCAAWGSLREAQRSEWTGGTRFRLVSDTRCGSTVPTCSWNPAVSSSPGMSRLQGGTKK